MAAPTVVAVGTITTWNVTSSPATVDISWPTHQADDIGICVVVGKNYDFTPPAGWTKITFSGFGTSESTTALSIGLYWKRATSGSEAAFTVPTTYAAVGRITTVRGCPTSGSPVDVFQSQNDAGAGGTSYSVNGVSTTAADELALYFCGGRLGTGFAFNTWTGASGVTWTDQGEGGGTARRVCQGTGPRASSGSTGAATANANTSINGFAGAVVALLATTTQQYNKTLSPSASATSTITNAVGKVLALTSTLGLTFSKVRTAVKSLTLTSTLALSFIRSRGMVLTKATTTTATRLNSIAKAQFTALTSATAASFTRQVRPIWLLTRSLSASLNRTISKTLTSTASALTATLAKPQA
jgi:hypothetical protein